MKTLIKFLFLLLIHFPAISYASGIYGNGTGSEDSIAVSVHLTDSLGNPSGTLADSFYVSIIGPSGDSIFTLAGLASTSGLDIDSLQTTCVGWKYIYSQAVSEIDGSGRPGTYELTFCAKDNNPGFVNCTRSTFQVISSHLSDQLESVSTILDSLLAALDTLQNQDDWVSSFNSADDTVFSDAVKISGDNQAADNWETMLDGTGGNKLTLAGLNVRALGNDTAAIVEASGTGTGLGLYIIGGGNGGEGVKILGGNTKSALVAVAGATVGSTHGFDLVGDGEGYGMNGSLSNSCRQSISDAVWDEDTTGHGAANSFGLMIKDTAAYQGGASGLTAAEIADSVWDEIQIGHASSGTFGAYLDSPVSSIEAPSGGGIYPVTVIAYDSANEQVIPGVRLAIHNMAMEALLATGLTDADGSTAFNLDPDTCIISAFAPGYIFGVYDTLIVTGAAGDTICGYRFDPGQPASPDLCRVYGYLYGINGLPLEGVTITAQITEEAVRYGSVIISPYKTTAATDSIGYFEIDLIPSAFLNPAGISYLISASYPSGTIMKKSLTVPDSDTWLITW